MLFDSVPLTITMLVIGFYIFMGALLFGVWEDWEALEASYFCFVTISTIGFGDLVPGSANFENTEDHYKMIVSAFYMMFGKIKSTHGGMLSLNTITTLVFLFYVIYCKTMCDYVCYISDFLLLHVFSLRYACRLLWWIQGHQGRPSRFRFGQFHVVFSTKWPQ